MSEPENPVVDAVADVVVEDKAAIERERIQGVLAHSMPGLEDMVSALAFDGKTTPDQAATLVLAETKKRMATQAASLANDAPPPVGAAQGEDEEDTTKGIRAKWNSLHPAVKANYADFDAYAAALTRTADLAKQGRVNHFSRTK